MFVLDPVLHKEIALVEVVPSSPPRQSKFVFAMANFALARVTTQAKRRYASRVRPSASVGTPLLKNLASATAE